MRPRKRMCGWFRKSRSNHARCRFPSASVERCSSRKPPTSGDVCSRVSCRSSALQSRSSASRLRIHSPCACESAKFRAAEKSSSHGTANTRQPYRRASSMVASSEPVSTRMISSATDTTDSRHSGRNSASLRAMMQTLSSMGAHALGHNSMPNIGSRAKNFTACAGSGSGRHGQRAAPPARFRARPAGVPQR
jgi:hypothetical protein